MILLVRAVLGSIALFVFAWGLRLVFTRDTMGAEFFVAPVGTGGLSTIRGDLGGALLAASDFIAPGLIAEFVVEIVYATLFLLGSRRLAHA
jgi:hypothetical protein